jgi:hypothetical protein
MELFILLPIFVSYVAIRECAKLKQERDIYYSNYQNCLLALKEHDPKLAKYLKEQEK